MSSTANTTTPPLDTSASDAVIERLHTLHPVVIDLSLTRVKELLAALGNPHEKLPPVIHVAGTNGKGSTTAFMRAIAEAAGYKVHTYTSPHLVRFHERIRLSGKLISETQLTELLARVEKAADGKSITFFEITTAAAFLAFSETPADLVILETGLGGRLDATNVVDKPLLSVITPISMDHEHYLGDSLTAIAREKAGIIKAGSPVVIGPQRDAAKTVLKDQADTKGSPIIEASRHWHVSAERDDTFLYQDGEGQIRLPLPGLSGDHQRVNAGTAIAALRHQKALRIPPAAIRAGLEWARWPARLEALDGTVISKALPEGSKLWLDGGHNVGAAEILKSFLASEAQKQASACSNSPPVIYLIVGMLETKDARGFLRALAALGARVIAVPIEGEKSAANPGKIAATATDVGMNGLIARDCLHAAEMIKSQHTESTPPLVLIAGPLYLAGRVLKLVGRYPQ